MAASPNQTLRSSSRRNSTLHDSSLTVIPSSPATYLGKRAHDSLLANDYPQVTKKQKLGNQLFTRPKSTARNHVAKAFAAVAANSTALTNPAVNSDLSSRITNAVQPPANGTIISNGYAHVHPGQTSKSTQTTNGKGRKESDKRTLRSQDGGTRRESELSLYFPNYEEIISNEPKETEFLTPETQILIIDELPKSSPLPLHNPITSIPHPITSTSQLTTSTPQPTTSTPSQRLLSPTSDLTAFQKLDFTLIANNQSPITIDPLPASVYFKPHRRAERQEKQLRNIEKERAQHEKVQLERLLDGLKSHDWLRVMGISGITDSERKVFEPKRDFFIREVSSLIAKFRRWKEEEKRRKVGGGWKGAGSVSASAAAEDDEEDSMPTTPSYSHSFSTATDQALAARQLHQEASSSSLSTHPPKSHKTPHLHQHQQNNPPHIPPSLDSTAQPFTSFYSKPYQREAAISKHRRGRTRFAFGCPVPEVAEREFELPPDLLTEEMIRASRRRNRRVRRGRADTG